MELLKKGHGRREICEYSVLHIIGPHFSRKIACQISHNFPCPQKSFCLKFRARFCARLGTASSFFSARSAPLKPQETGEALRPGEFPEHPLLSDCVQYMPATLTPMIKMEDKCSQNNSSLNKHFSRQNFVMRFCGERGT